MNPCLQAQCRLLYVCRLMRVVFDTNIILDVILQRDKHLPRSAALTAYASEGRITGFLGATTFTTVFYFARRATSSYHAHETIQR